MAVDDIDDWVVRARAAAQQVVDGFEGRMGYEPEVQEIRMTSQETTSDLSELPDAARAFFSRVEEVSWPDIWNGYFLGPAIEMTRRFRDHEPGWLKVGEEGHRCFAFGSDGGGAYFVLDLDARGTVLRVSDATVRDGVLQGHTTGLAPDFGSFLERLLENVVAVATGQEPSF